MRCCKSTLTRSPRRRARAAPAARRGRAPWRPSGDAGRRDHRLAAQAVATMLIPWRNGATRRRPHRRVVGQADAVKHGVGIDGRLCLMDPEKLFGAPPE
jgi:hypothetical protein